MGHELVIPDLALRWLSDRRRFAVATLIEVDGSAPLDPGAAMVIDADGNVEGSVTGGCVESALAGEAASLLGGGGPRVVSYGISDELAGTVGLMCGGNVRILVSEAGPELEVPLRAVSEALAAARAVALVTLLDGPSAGRMIAVTERGTAGELGVDQRLDAAVARDAEALLAQGVSMVRRFGADGTRLGDELGLFIRSFGEPPRIVIVGAVDFAVALAGLGAEMGFRVTICDAREPFVTGSRFRRAAEVVTDWPDHYLDGQRLGPRDAVLIFTHDPKFDAPAAIAALRSGAGYIGAMGSRQTHDDRSDRLRSLGVSDDELGRISSPCGLDIGSSTPAETAVSILAEITALRTGRGGGRLTDGSGPIRDRAGATDPIGGGA